VNLRQLVRTSSFRLTLLYAAVTSLSFLLLFAVVFWSTTQYLRHQIDTTVAAEIKEVRVAANDGSTQGLSGAVDSLVRQAEGFYYLLQDARGDKVAGNLPPRDAVPGVREWRERTSHRPGGRIEIRGLGQATDDGGYLFVGMNAHVVRELRESVAQSFLWAAAAAMLLVFGGGALMSAAVLRRIEVVSRTSRDIIEGDLARRIALSGSGDEFDRLAMSLNAMLDRIGELMEGLRQVSNDIAHDLRTPLTRLRQRLELAQQRKPDSEALVAVVEKTIADIDSILDTFGALLRIAQIESGTRKANFRDADLSALLHNVADVYEPAIEDGAQFLHLDIAPQLVVRGDQELLTQLFANLVENAARHGPPGTHIKLAGCRVGDAVEVTVSDNGPGIPPAQRDKVLRRFHRLDVSRTTPGNGLGLSLAQAVAGLHDTRLELADNDPGLRVVVRFAAMPDSTGRTT